MAGVLLNKRTGRPELDLGVLQTNMERGWRIRGMDADPPDLSRLPDSTLDLLERSGRIPGFMQPRASNQGWEETIYATIADGTQVIASTSETIMVPDFTLPANYLYPGRVLKYTIFFNTSTVITTPGTITLRLRWGGVAGTLLAASGAYAPDPTAASTTVSGYAEFWLVCRAIGTAAASFTMGRMWLNDFDDASAATIVGNLNMGVIPASAPAAVNINTTTANALSPTVQFSVTTATTQFTAHLATLESLS